MKDRILLEEIPSGQEYLYDIIEAMKHSQIINMTYQSYWRTKSNNFNVEPYCVKLFKQRWYLVARSTYNNKVMIYSLDRIITLDVLADEKFKMPDSFNPTEFFSEYYGVIVDEEQTVEKVTFKVTSAQANYLRSLPMHHSQQEIERTSEFSIFQIVIKPTYDFQQEILKNGEDIEVLEPLWLRNKITDKIKGMWNKYNQKEDI
jgi:predicted DNA-binding transcriptional regulator YafY